MQHAQHACNPVSHPQGKDQGREFFCRFYDECLDTAVEKGWPGFSCRRCGACEPVRWDEERRRDDNNRCTALLLAVMHSKGVKNANRGRIVALVEANFGKRRENAGFGV